MKWNKKIYIAKKLDLGNDDYGNQVEKFDTPVEYEFNVQPISSSTDLMEFGIKASTIQRAVIPMSYKGVFKEGDRAYLDDITPTGETKSGDKANYKLYPPRNQNKVIIIYFERIAGK